MGTVAPFPPTSQRQAWLVRLDGLHAGMRYRLDADLAVIGRDPRCEISVRGAKAAFVSAQQAEIRRVGEELVLHDLNSTNGTYVNGNRVESIELEDGALIELGQGGPQFTFQVQTPKPRVATAPPEKRQADADSSTALSRGTAEIMRRAITVAQQGVRRRWLRTVWAISIALAVVSGYAVLTTWRLHREKGDVGRQIRAIESRLEAGGDDAREVRRLLAELERYQQVALQLEQNILYQLTEPDRDQLYVERELRELLLEFGAEQTVAPPDFSARVLHYVREYQGPNRAIMRRALVRSRDRFERMRAQFENAHLPPDLAYLVLVESELLNGRSSGRGAAGLWQLLPGTARQYGLEVNAETDERLDPLRSTEAAARHMRSLILEFGSGSSVLLALAAYNGGAARVKSAVRRVEDPIAQRNFWYLYASRNLPAETLEYVPKVLAAIVIGRNPDRFGF